MSDLILWHYGVPQKQLRPCATLLHDYEIRGSCQHLGNGVEAILHDVERLSELRHVPGLQL